MNIALIGLGMVAGTHIAAIQDAGLHLRGVLASSAESTRTAAARHDTHGYASVDEIAQDGAVDFVIIATPPNARADIAETLVQAGKPMLMEKPIERDLATATGIVKACEAADVPLGIVFQHRAREASAALKSLIETGALGQIATIDLRVPWWRDQSYYDEPGRGSYARDGGGVMISQAIHTLDLALWLCGGVTSVQAMMRQTGLHSLEAEDWAGALLEMQNGAVGTLTATTAAYPGGAETITIQGSKAAAHLGSGVLTIYYLDGRCEMIGATGGTGGGADPMAFTHDWHRAVIADFAEALETGRTPLATGRSALAVHAVIDAMERASRSGARTEVTI
ncbi:MAG: Gfo/Idh/MocA family oxidoreductase [Pseudomonadota bacterium]